MANNLLDEEGRSKMFQTIADKWNEAMKDFTPEEQKQAVDMLSASFFMGPVEEVES